MHPYNDVAILGVDYIRENGSAHMQVIVSAANMWVAIFTVIMQMGVSVALIRVVFLWCIMHMTVSIITIHNYTGDFLL